MKSSCVKQIIIIVSIACGIASSFGGYYYYLKSSQSYIDDFNSERDTKPILDIFKKNWDELVEGYDYSPEFMMKHRTPNTDPTCFGILKIKVMREKDRLAGFVAYYSKTPQEGIVLFLAVSNDFRGKHYGQALMQYAIKDLLLMGAKSVGLWVLINNVPARKVYEKLGFVEESFDDTNENVYLEYKPAP
jgi:ribosomal protein S18 acetylase RimI-like enzyme